MLLRLNTRADARDSILVTAGLQSFSAASLTLPVILAMKRSR